jgi:threonylcarbamoyladenosine tRNA methylthiotransferase MtaB
MADSRRYKIITLGCKVNQGESDAIGGGLEKAGWQPAVLGEPADLCIVNTCTVTGRASMQSRQAVRQAIRAYPEARMIVTGCYAQTEPGSLAGIEGVDCVVGHSHKHEILDRIADENNARFTLIADVGRERIFRPFPEGLSGNRSRPFLKIQDGCDAFCTYCIVPYARGRSRSMAVPDVLAHLERLNQTGYQEVVIAGIHLGAYGQDLTPSTDLTRLLSQIQCLEFTGRIRISSVEPHELTHDIIRIAAESDRFCRHFHIPLQSGDDEVLKRMRRPYTRKYFRDLAEEILCRMPDAAVGVDVLLGFPGESAEGFENTCKLIQELPAAYLHVFPFSAREGTPASTFPDPVPADLIKERCRRVREIGAVKRKIFYENTLGRTVQVLIESRRDNKTGHLKGLGSNYLKVLAEGPDTLKNTLQSVIIEKILPQAAAAFGRIKSGLTIPQQK